MIYELKFSYYEDNSENNDEIIIAVYSSYKKAEIGKKKFSQQPRFKGKEEFLEINEYKINEAEWNEGFWRATKSYFIIKLLNNYGKDLNGFTSSDSEDSAIDNLDDAVVDTTYIYEITETGELKFHNKKIEKAIVRIYVKEDKTIAAILADRLCGGMGVAFALGGSL